VDYPDLIRKKRHIVLSTKQLQDILVQWEESDESPVLLRSERYCQIGCDLGQLPVLEQSLCSVVDASNSLFLFVAEVSITYMDTLAADGLIQWASTIGNGERGRI
jgi:tRNA wybutosine-synthesizing protein 4